MNSDPVNVHKKLYVPRYPRCKQDIISHIRKPAQDEVDLRVVTKSLGCLLEEKGLIEIGLFGTKERAICTKAGAAGNPSHV